MEMDVKGGCMFLKNGRCSIYKKRPISCGTYDCRPEEERYDDEDEG
jgi:Fe-S-cluster containining protein